MSGTRRTFLKVVASQGALAATVTALPGCVSTLDPAPLIDAVQQSGLVILSPRLYPELVREGWLYTQATVKDLANGSRLEDLDGPNLPAGNKYARTSNKAETRA